MFKKQKNKVIIFWSTERGYFDRCARDNKPKDGEWVVEYTDSEQWIDTFSTKEEAVEFCQKNSLDFSFSQGIM